MLEEDDNDEPYGLGHWMIEEDHKARVENRIACEELGYPQSEAMYPNIAAWEEATGLNWYDFLNL